ncbi:thioredoxin family protein [Nitrosophilus alvini]|uniref:thioredoxin family protein n=1 Tax=Nitrosophilus alvini TaxID=2714855 RepID=UPI001909505F|nr:DUF255 domain-containing protein [Nitrosophilus alvini]
MFKKALVMAIIAIFSYGAQIEWFYDYQKALQYSKKENKPLMIFMESDYCRWCKKMKRETFTDTKIVQIINRYFIALQLNREDKDYPVDKITARVVPTTFFLTPDEKLIIRPVEGYWDAESFIYDLNRVIEKYVKPRVGK